MVSLHRIEQDVYGSPGKPGRASLGKNFPIEPFANLLSKHLLDDRGKLFFTVAVNALGIKSPYRLFKSFIVPPGSSKNFDQTPRYKTVRAERINER